MSDAWDVIVVGSGVGGLTTAAYLATNGRRVLVLESQAVIGGMAQTFKRNRVFEFDCGAHYVGDCEPDGIIPSALRGVGLDGVVEFANMDHDAFDRILGPDDFELRVPRGWDAFANRLVETYPTEEQGIRAVLRTLRRTAEAMEQLGAPPMPRPVDVLRKPRLWPALKDGAGTLEALFDKHGLSESARAAVGYICMFLLIPRQETVVAVYAYSLNHYVKSGGWYPRGGAGRIPHALARVVRAHDGEIRLRTRVERVLVEAGRVRGVRLADGSELHADVVVTNADIKTNYGGELIEARHLRRTRRRRFAKARLTPSLFSVYLGVDVDLREHIPAQHAFAFDSWDYESRLHSTFYGTRETFDYDRLPIWITSTTVKDQPPAGTEGYSSIEIATGTPQSYEFWGLDGGVLDGVDYHDDPGYLAQKKRIEDAVVERTLEVMPFLRDHIVWQESSTMLSHEDWTRVRNGAWAGLDFSLRNMLFRPGPRTEVRGLYLTGASNNCAGAIVGTLRGGVETASAILGHDVWQQVRSGTVFGRGLDDTGFRSRVGAAGFHRLAIRDVQPCTPDAVAIEFDVPSALRSEFAFRPGQHVTVRGLREGDPVRRAYSICEPSTTGRLRIGVKKVGGGLFSDFAVDEARAGDVLDVAAPRGSFAVDLDPTRSRTLVGIAAGSGITPILSIIGSVLDVESRSTCTLLYGSRGVDDIMFAKEIDSLAERFTDRFRVVHHLSRDHHPDHRTGRLDAEALSSHLTESIDATRVDDWFLCGPPAMVDAAVVTLGEYGVDLGRVHVESFDTTPRGPKSATPSTRKSTVHVNLGADGFSVQMSRSGATILEEAIRVRDDLPYSCMSGSCGSCKVRVCSGDVDIEDGLHDALTETERADGFTLACLARPSSDEVHVEFPADAVRL